jgi:uncharacterized membrane protein
MDLETTRTEKPINQPRLVVAMSYGNRSSAKWLALVIILLLAWVGLPWLAPIMMKVGLESIAKPIYGFYSFQCHQLPQRSFFLFGPTPMISLSEIQATWQNTDSPIILRQFIGNSQMGYKVAWSDRMVSAYTSIPLAGILWWIFRKRLPFLPLWGVVLLALPMAIDGTTHMFSDLGGIGQGFRYSNQWLAELTRNSLPASFYEGTTLGSFNSWMRLISGSIFGLGLGWFIFPRLALSMGVVKPTVKVEMARAFPDS